MNQSGDTQFQKTNGYLFNTVSLGTINKITLFTALGLGAIVLISCTANFASNLDKSNIMYSYDMGSTRYANENDLKPAETDKLTIDNVPFDNVYAWQDYTYDYKGGYARTLSHTDTQGVVASAIASKIDIPSDKYWEEMDKFTLKEAWKWTWDSEKEDSDFRQRNPSNNILECNTTATKDDIIHALDEWGPIKFSGIKDGEKNEIMFSSNVTPIEDFKLAYKLKEHIIFSL